MITIQTEKMAHNDTVRPEQRLSLHLIRRDNNENWTDSISISAEARERHKISSESALVRAVCMVCPGSVELIKDIEAAYDRQRAEKVRRVKAILTNGADEYSSGSDAA